MDMHNRETLLMDYDWLFHKGDFPKDKIVEHMYTYDLCKTTRGHGPASVSFSDEDWERVQLPHDYLLAGVPSPDENGIKGSYPRPNAWYRKYFRIGQADHDRRLSLMFEGVATHSVVYLNGHLLHRSFSGYTSFDVDITDFVRFGEELNVLSVYINNHESEGWWYEGAGIYRHVWLIKTGLVSIDTWGTFVRTEKRQNELWNACIDVELRNDLYESVEGRIVSVIRDDQGHTVGQGEAPFRMDARSKATFTQNILAVQPALWSTDAPNMHILTTRIYVGDVLMDDFDTPFGFRTIQFDSDRGFLLNDRPMKIKGLCAHQDHGGLGAAVPDSVQAFRVRAFKGSGSNALRSTHNPASPSLLDACDRLGMMVMDENRWLVSSRQRLSELTTMIRRDRNHPSIIFWSLFNEDPILEKPAGSNMFHAMHALAEKLDTSRAIIGAPVKNVGAMDYIRSSKVMGFNYNFEMVDLLHKCWHKPHINTETHQGNYLGGNDGWRLAALRPYVMGIFCWGVETRGETYWPRLYAPWGIMDGLCYPKVHYELYRNSYWTDRPSIKIVPMLDYPAIHTTSPCWLNQDKPRQGLSWNARDLEGKMVDVWVYTNTSLVELFLNGRSLGLKYSDPFEQVCWHVPYEPGELVAVARDTEGSEIVRDVLSTTGDPVGLRFEVHNERLLANGEDCAVITAYAVDTQGNFVPDADGIPVNFGVNDHGTLLAVANGEPTDHHAPSDPTGLLWNGRCQLIIRSDAQPGDLVVTADSDQLGHAELSIVRAHGKRRPYVERADSCFISSVDVSNYLETLPDAISADGEGRITWTNKPFDKRLFTDLPVGFNALSYRMDLTMPAFRHGRRALFFEHLVGRVHVQALSNNGEVMLDLHDDNDNQRYTLDLSSFDEGERVRLYMTTEIDPPTYFGPNPYWRFIGMYGFARWIGD